MIHCPNVTRAATRYFCYMVKQCNQASNGISSSLIKQENILERIKNCNEKRIHDSYTVLFTYPLLPKVERRPCASRSNMPFSRGSCSYWKKNGYRVVNKYIESEQSQFSSLILSYIYNLVMQFFVICRAPLLQQGIVIDNNNNFLL